MSDLWPSTADQAHLERALRALLSPLEHENVDEWRSEVNVALAMLLDADTVAFQLPLDDIDDFYTEDFDRSVMAGYLPMLAEMDPKYRNALHRTAELKVCNRQQLWNGALDEYYSSAYYNEFIVSIRAYDMLCAATSLEREGPPAMLYLHHQSPTGRRFGTRGRRLLRLLHPAFVNGIRTLERLRGVRASFVRLLDSISDCVLLYDMDGRLRHRNAGFHDLELTRRSEGAVLDVAGALAANLAALCRARRSRARTGRGPVARRLWLDARTFVARATLWERAPGAVRPMIFVTLREEAPRAAPHPKAESTISTTSAERFGLTAREADVAVLLARRHTNREIAEDLGISPHTARHHTQRVLRKMDVHSRREVLAKLRGDDPAPGRASTTSTT